MKRLKIVWGVGLVVSWIVVLLWVNMGMKVPMIASPIISAGLVVATTLFIAHDLYERVKW